MTATGRTRTLRMGRPVLLRPIFAQLRRGPADPTHRQLGDIWLRATRTPVGAALLKVVASGETVAARAWGEGAVWALDQLPRLLGEADHVDGFAPRPEHPTLVEAHGWFADYLVEGTAAVFESLVPACLEQLVTGAEAYLGFRLLVR